MYADITGSRGRETSGCGRTAAVLYIALASLLFACSARAQVDSANSGASRDSIPPAASQGVPVVFGGDTLFSVYSPLGEFVASERAEQIISKLRFLARNDWNLDALRLLENDHVTDALLDTLRVFSVTDSDAVSVGMARSEVAARYRKLVIAAVRERRGQLTIREILADLGLALVFAAALVAVFWAFRRVFPRIYAQLERWEGSVIRSVRFRSHELLSAASLSAFAIILAKGVRLAVSLALLYYFVVYILSIIPWTQSWDPGPLLRGLLYSVLLTALTGVVLRAGRSFFASFAVRIETWKGTLIKPVRIKTVEVLSEERIVELTKGIARVVQFAALVVLGYFYVTLMFSFFWFSQTWAAQLFGYIIDPLKGLLVAVVTYLPSLFFILVIIFVTRYVIKFIHLIFTEMGKGTISLSGFHVEWAEPTYKIVRFLVIAFAAIVIFPYLPGSGSPAFQGISVFLGVLFSLGSTSAIANVVAGTVLTYMRPFRVGDRVKIADTTGDVIEKTLLVTRVRTIKNVDVTIPNAMVLGSHIINFSSSAQERGLILHTGVTIGYGVPWKKVHELLLAAAGSTEGILKEPKPFVLQTSLDDFYVNYELNAFTDQPNSMAVIHSSLHQNIQDRFNEAGVEIMSPHYAAVRDGNQTTVPESYLPRPYQAPAFRIFPVGPAPKGSSDSSTANDRS